MTDALHSDRVGVLGLGRMGLPVARRLAAAGFAVTAFDPDEARSALLDGAVTAVADAAVLAANSDVLIVVLPGPPEFREALIGSGGALAQLSAGSILLDLTSNDPRVAAEVAAAARDRGVAMVGAPMGGGPAQAESGELTFFVGGAAPAIDRVTPLLSALGRLDQIGSRVEDGYTAKLLVNLLWFGQAAAVTEALLLGQSLGLDVGRLRDVLGGSAAGSAFIDRHLDLLLAGDYAATFGLDRVVEELDTLTGLAQQQGTPFTVSAEVASLHRQALGAFGPIDGELLVARLLEDRADARLRALSERDDVVPDGRE